MKITKTPQVRNTLSSDVQIVHAVVARSTLRSENVTNSSGSDHFGKSEAQFWVKMLKHHMFGPFFGVEASFYVAGTEWSLHLVKSVSDVWVLRQFQHDSRRGIFEKRICKTNQKDACRVAGASGTVQETSSSCC